MKKSSPVFILEEIRSEKASKDYGIFLPKNLVYEIDKDYFREIGI